MASSRITWQTVDQAMTRWSAVLGVLAVLAAVLAAYRFVSRALVEGIAASVLLVILLVGWWATSRLHRARVTLGEDGIIREGRGGFTLPWDQVRMVGIGEGLVSEVPYLVIATRPQLPRRWTPECRTRSGRRSWNAVSFAPRSSGTPICDPKRSSSCQGSREMIPGSSLGLAAKLVVRRCVGS